MFRKIIKDAKNFRFLLILAIICTFLATAINLLAPAVVRELISFIQDPNEGVSFTAYIVVLGIILISAYALRVILRFIMSYFSHKAAWLYLADLKVRVYKRLQDLPVKYYQDKQTGQLVSRVVADTRTLEVMIAHFIPDIITNIFVFAGVTSIVFAINWRLALLTCIPIPAIAALSFVMSKKMRPDFRQAQKDLGSLTADLTDNFGGIKEIQLFNRQEGEENKIKFGARAYSDSLLRALKKSAYFHPLIEFFTSLGTVIVIVAGGILAFRMGMPTADIVAFLLYLALFFGPVMALPRLIEDYQSAMAGAERVFEILDEKSDIIEKDDAEELTECKGEIVFENVTFEYLKGHPILKNVTITVPAGSMLAIVGPTGAGKTTLAGLVPRFFDTVSGRILIDGKDIRDIKLKSLRFHISMVLQDVFLFGGTVTDNISYANPEATSKEIEKAAMLAGIHEDIVNMPDGYKTVIGERGIKLSGGQKQRLSIARAVLRDSPILILDEATAAVDIETENKIRSAIQSLTGTRTIIVIAHRLSTVKKADQIIVLDNGTIAEQGTHENLIQKGGIYSKYFENS